MHAICNAGTYTFMRVYETVVCTHLWPSRVDDAQRHGKFSKAESLRDRMMTFVTQV